MHRSPFNVRRQRWAICGCLSLLLLAGCASPERRIRANPELFASLPPEQQEAVRAGRVQIGMRPAAVELALGPANRIYRRETAAGVTTVWSYTRIEVDRRLEFVTAHTRRGIVTVPVDVDHSREVEILRLEFLEERLIAIETRER